MGRTNGVTKHNVVNGDMSADVFGDAMDVTGIDSVGMTFIWDGATSPVGEFDVQYSYDATNWFRLNIVDTAGAAPVPSGASGNLILTVTEILFNYVRPSYHRTSGTGTMNVLVRGVRKGA